MIQQKNGEQSKNPSVPTVTIEDKLEPDLNDEVKLIRKTRIKESLKEQIEQQMIIGSTT